MEPLNLFLQDHEGHLKRLTLALNAQSFDEMRRLLHTMKGNADVFGLTHLVRYIHTLEWFVQKIQIGAIVLDEHSIKLLEDSILNLQGALAIYRVDPQNPLTLKEKIAEILQFIRDRVTLNVAESAATPTAKTAETFSQQEPMASSPIDSNIIEVDLSTTVAKPRFYLQIQQSGQTVYVPCHEIIQVLRHVSFLKIQTAAGQTKALARIAGELVPVRCTDKDILQCEWALLVRDTQESETQPRDKTICILADEIIGITELTTEEKQSFLSDLPAQAI